MNNVEIVLIVTDRTVVMNISAAAQYHFITSHIIQFNTAGLQTAEQWNGSHCNTGYTAVGHWRLCSALWNHFIRMRRSQDLQQEISHKFSSDLTLSVPVGTKSVGAPSWQSLSPWHCSGLVRDNPLLFTHNLNLAASLPAGSDTWSLSPADNKAWTNGQHIMVSMVCPVSSIVWDLNWHKLWQTDMTPFLNSNCLLHCDGFCLGSISICFENPWLELFKHWLSRRCHVGVMGVCCHHHWTLKCCLLSTLCCYWSRWLTAGHWLVTRAGPGSALWLRWQSWHTGLCWLYWARAVTPCPGPSQVSHPRTPLCWSMASTPNNASSVVSAHTSVSLWVHIQKSQTNGNTRPYWIQENLNS